MVVKKTILLTSVGSGVGRSLLRTLENRRENLVIVGLNSQAHENLYSCDLGLQSPETKSKEFIPFIQNVVLEHDVNLVIPCRDDDTVELSFAHDDTHSRICMPSGSGEVIRKFRDKWTSFLFAREIKLGFCDTACTDEETVVTSVKEILNKHGYPLIVKPRFGDGSRGVKLIRTADELSSCLVQPHLVIQPFLVEPSFEWQGPDLSDGVPLFWNLEPIRQGAIQIVISPKGDDDYVFCHFVTHNQGFPEIVERSDNVGLNRFAMHALDTLKTIGWRGVLNISLMSKNANDWEPIEFNARFTGSTSSRYLMGFDEVGIVLNQWLGSGTIPISHFPDRNRISLSMQEHFSYYNHVTHLMRDF